MKNVLKAGKWMALLIGAAALFAGCMGPSSSDDNAIPAKGGEAGGIGANYVYKFSVDPQAGKLDIEPVVMGTATSSTHFGGNVDVTSTCAGYPLACSITIKNTDPTKYLENLRTWEYKCTGCAGATLDTADFPTIAPQLVAESANSGMCILSDGVWSQTLAPDQSPKGCLTYTYVAGYTSPYQFLHPECGSLTDTWTFNNQATVYTFYTALVDIAAANTAGDVSWYEENLTGDTRNNMTDFTTFKVLPYDLRNKCVDDGICQASFAKNDCTVSATNAFAWKMGSAYCSYPLAGPVQVGQYFAVNIGLEFPDRIENQNHATLGGSVALPDACFEYQAASAAALYSWDASVLGLVTTSRYTPTGATFMSIGDRNLFGGDDGIGGPMSEGTMANYRDSITGYNVAPSAQTMATNYSLVVRGLTAGAFTFATAGAAGCRPNVLSTAVLTYQLNQPLMGQGWSGLATFGNGGAQCNFTDDPVDAAVDFWINVDYLWVKGASGTGSILKIEPTVNYTTNSWYNSNCTRAGGTNSAQDIRGGWCWPCTGNACTRTGSSAIVCTYAQGNLNSIIAAAREQTNPNIAAGAPYSLRGKGLQIKNSHICVQ